MDIFRYHSIKCKISAAERESSNKLGINKLLKREAKPKRVKSFWKKISVGVIETVVSHPQMPLFN
jgi:hypothetical protein